MEDGLHFIESELVPDLRNRLFNFIFRIKLAIFQKPLQHFKEPKSQGLMFGGWNGCNDRET
jgi:hypothetical protein